MLPVASEIEPREAGGRDHGGHHAAPRDQRGQLPPQRSVPRFAGRPSEADPVGGRLKLMQQPAQGPHDSLIGWPVEDVNRVISLAHSPLLPPGAITGSPPHAVSPTAAARFPPIARSYPASDTPSSGVPLLTSRPCVRTAAPG